MTYPSFMEVRSEGNRRCIIVFSSFALRDYGPQSFSFKKHFETYCPGVDFVFVKDVANQWYNRELSGMGENLSQNIEALRRKVADYDHVTTFGSSMGGYASLLYGRALGAHHIVALSPQTFLRSPFPRYNDNDHCGEYVDLSATPSAGSALVDVFVGENELFDMYQLVQLKSAWGAVVNPVVVPNAAHHVVKLFDDKAILPQLLRLLCSNSDADPLARIKEQYLEKQASFTCFLLGKESFVSGLSEAVEYYYLDRARALRSLQKLLEYTAPFNAHGWPGALAMLGMVHYSRGEATEALAQFEYVSSMSNTVCNFYEAYASLVARQGEPDKAVSIALKGQEIDPGNRRVLIKTVELLESMGFYEQSRICRRRLESLG